MVFFQFHNGSRLLPVPLPRINDNVRYVNGVYRLGLHCSSNQQFAA